jgi:HPt (histidine-containing phosphotransfer) domain-containing protein
MNIQYSYINSKVNLPAELKEMLRDGRFEEIRLVGHKLYGSGAMYGLRAFSYLGKRIERAALQQDSESLAKLIEQFEAQMLYQLTLLPPSDRL